MGYRPHDPATPLLFGYDPVRDLPPDHLARLIDEVVEQVVEVPHRFRGPGQPAFNPRLTVKVLIYGYCTGVRSSRRMEQHCQESLPYLFLTRGDGPSYRTLCTVRKEQSALIEQAWLGLFGVAAELGIEQVGCITVDTTKLRANASAEAVVKQEEYEALREELERILAQAEQVDVQEEDAGRRMQTQTGRTAKREQMRAILRRVRRKMAVAKRGLGSEGERVEGAEEEQPELSARMRERVAAAAAAVQSAMAQGREYLCLTDPDAVMMGEGCEKKIRECHSFELAVDNGSGMLMAGDTTQEGNDNGRLEGLVKEAGRHEPEGVQEADGDSGFYENGVIARLNAAGIETCVPDSHTACDLHRGLPIGTTRGRQGSAVELSYDEAADCFRCPQGEVLSFRQSRREGGQPVKVYVAQCDCRACPMAGECLRQERARHRTVKVGAYDDILAVVRKRFEEPAYQERYRHRGERVEGVFGFMRSVLAFQRWLLRGKEGVAAEGRLLKTAYQFRKLHTRWRTSRAVA